MKKTFCVIISTILMLTGCSMFAIESNDSLEEPTMTKYYFPAEDKKHEGTWLNWPHHYTYGVAYRNEIEEVWIEMAYALHKNENVHIIAYNEAEKKRIFKLLKSEMLDMSKIDFVIAKSDDVWSRDTGPMFVYDESGNLAIADFAFDGWGGKTAYENDDTIPTIVAKAKNIPVLNIPDFVLEGGSVELDGKGTLMACKSSVVSRSRNPKMTVEKAEDYLRKYLGATNFIWLEGVEGEDITDAHIDGMARFYDDKTLLTVSKNDFLEMYENINESDYELLLTAQNAQGQLYKIIELPMTAKNVYGLDYKGSYLNYYVGNNVVLLPIYNDKNDKIAIDIVTQLYSDREIIPIDVSFLFQYGGMLHCITQQQPINLK